MVRMVTEKGWPSGFEYSMFEVKGEGSGNYGLSLVF